MDARAKTCNLIPVDEAFCREMRMKHWHSVVVIAFPLQNWGTLTPPHKCQQGLYIYNSKEVLEVKLPTICRDGKAEAGRVREEKSRSEKILVRDGESQKRQDAGARKGREVAIHCVFPMICGSGGSKSNLARAAGAEPAGQMRDETVRAAVARSTFPSQKCPKPTVSDHFWKLRCRKSARHCGAKHMSKSKCTKHTNIGPRLEVELSKKCKPLWCEAHFQVKSVKRRQFQTTFGS